MNRDEFLARVEQAAVSGRQHRVKTNARQETVGYVGCDQDRCAALAAEVTAVGGEAHLVRGDQEARTVLDGLLTELAPTAAFCWEHPLLERLQVEQSLANHRVACDGFQSLKALEEDARREAMLNAEIGISSVDYAVAETGSLVVCAGPGRERMVSLLPPVHVALVDESQIVPDLYDVFGQLTAHDPPQLPSNVAFITGPSKTGDIELQLTTGVHGPGRWIVIIIRDH